MVMKALRDGASGGITKFILFGFLVMAVGGLVLMDVGGFFRGGGVSHNDVAKVGDQNISIASFDRNVRVTLQRIGMTPEEAYRVGYVDQILNSEIRSRLLNLSAGEMGVMIDRSRIAKQIADLLSPMMTKEQNAEDVLHQVLLNQGISEQMFVENIGRDMANDLLMTALGGGLQDIPDSIIRDLYAFQNEKRSIEYISFPASELKDLPEPTNEQLAALYEGTKETYAINEKRVLKLVSIKDDALKSTIDISDEQARQNYEENIDLYTVNEQRTLEQAILPTEELAQTVKIALDNGKNLKTAVKDTTGNETAYLGEKVFEEKTLLDEIKNDVLAAEKNGAVIGPTKTPLGWYVLVVKKISPRKIKNFDEVKKEIRDEMLESQLIDQQYALANTVDDMLASGATLEEVQKEVDLAIADLPPMNRFGQNAEGKDALKDYEKDRSLILDTGFALEEEGETSAVLEMADGHFRAIHLATLAPKTYEPFETVKGDIKKQWMEDQRRVSNQLRAAQALAEFEQSGKTLKEFAADKKKSAQLVKSIARDKEPAEPLNPRSIGSVFEAPVHTPVLVDIEGGYALAMVTDFTLPDAADEKVKEYVDLKDALRKGLRDEGLIQYLQEKQNQYGARVNKPLLDQLYGPEAKPF